MATVNALCMTVMLILIVPTTHSFQGSDEKKSHKSSDTSVWYGQTAYFLLGVLVLITLQFFLIGCCPRVKKATCYKRLKDHIQGILGSTENGEQSDDNSPPPYTCSNALMEDMQIDVIKCPPYVRYPPSYSEAVGIDQGFFTDRIYI